jgi:hypothetical protein
VYAIDEISNSEREREKKKKEKTSLTARSNAMK